MSIYRLLDGALVATALSADVFSAAPTSLHGPISTATPHVRSPHQVTTDATQTSEQLTTNREAVPKTQQPRGTRRAAARLLQSAGYPDCYGFTASMGTGRCTPENNNKECGFDGGDCCECTCVDSRDHACGSYGYDCRDPDATCTLAAGSQGLSSAPRRVAKGVLGAGFAIGIAIALAIFPV